jgi:Domain of unknown function (DUF5122) beta-propeller
MTSILFRGLAKVIACDRPAMLALCMIGPSITHAQTAGSFDPSFTPPIFDPPITLTVSLPCIAVQPDRKILVAGTFAGVNGVPRANIARLFPDGTLDHSFHAGTNANGAIDTLALQPESRIKSRPWNWDMIRLHNGAATGSLTVTGDSKVQWMRGGTAPEVGFVTFERSMDGGATWTMLGRGARVSGGWELAVPGLPPDASIRARGRTAGGSFNASTGIVERTLNVPDIAVASPQGTEMFDGSLFDFGPVVTGVNGVRQLAPNGNRLELRFRRPAAAETEVTYRAEWTDALNAAWSTIGSTAPEVLSDDGTWQEVKVTVPAGTGSKRFVRLRVTKL